MSWESTAEYYRIVGLADSPVPLFPSTRLHVEAAVTRALRDEAQPM